MEWINEMNKLKNKVKKFKMKREMKKIIRIRREMKTINKKSINSKLTKKNKENEN